jgi:hypothetical protein
MITLKFWETISIFLKKVNFFIVNIILERTMLVKREKDPPPSFKI